MGRRLRMTVELGDWRAELGDSEPATAAEVGAALVAVLESADPSALAILGQPSIPPGQDPRETTDHLYQQMLAELQYFRRRVSDVATQRRRAELRLEAAAGTEATQLADIERNLAAAGQREAELSEQSQRLQWKVDAFRAAKESAKALYTSADAQLRIAGAIAALEGRSSDADLAKLREAVRAADDRIERVAAEGLAVLQQIREQAGDGEQARPPSTSSAAGLLELRVGPFGSDIRMLLAMEPADTVTLLAVLEGPEAASEHGAEAVGLASDLLTEIRAEGWPPDVDKVALDDAAALLARFFPADDGHIRRRAAALAPA